MPDHSRYWVVKKSGEIIGPHFGRRVALDWARKNCPESGFEIAGVTSMRRRGHKEIVDLRTHEWKEGE